MNYKNILPFLALIFTLQFLSAQQSKAYYFDLKEYNEALTLYNNKQYQASQILFNKVYKKTTDNETIANCDYYIANCAIRLNQRGADKLMEAFVKNHPTSTKRNSAFMDVADYYFENGKYTLALKWYTMAEPSSMSKKEEERFNFNLGYCLFASKKYEQSKKYFNRLITSNQYGSQAKYYIGFMAYEGDDFQEASTYFDQISDDDRLNKKLSYYQADMNFKLGEFEKAISLAEQQLAKGDRKEVSELSKIIGESHFNLGNYGEAINFLTAYKGQRGRWNNVDYYQLGYAYYKQKDYTNAIAQFNKIIEADNAVAQNAYYHLGECYLNSDKKQEALNAFRNASQMDYSTKIQEDAWLNYAKLSYEIGNPYQAVPEVLMAYLETYPSSPFKAEINELLISSYITSKNYAAALNLLESNNSYANKAAYQKVAFYRAIELFNESNYEESNAFFVKSLKDELDINYTARALYWKAETEYRRNNFKDAVVSYKQFLNHPGAAATEEFKNANYNLAYSYFKQKEYSQAVTYFTKYAAKSTGDQDRLADTYLRLGDANFVDSNYWPAMEAYNKAIKMDATKADYAYYQKAISYGFLRRNNDKVAELIKFTNAYPRSTLRDDALYELGNTYVATNQTSKGVETYNQLINEFKSSSYVAKALLKVGLIHYNSEENERALTTFKRVVQVFPRTPEANQAIATARLIYIDLGKVDEYAAWINTLDFVEVSDADLDNTTFEAAEKQFLQNNLDAALRSLSGYLGSFSKGLHALKANFYLGETYFRKNRKEEAIDHYANVINTGRTDFTEQALARLSQIYLEKSNWSMAKPLLERLEKEADFPQNITFAQSNLMKVHYELKDYAAAVSYADTVLQNTKIDNQIESDAQLIIARSAMKTNNPGKARVAYAEVQKIATGALAAEALYYDAYFKHADKQYQASNTAVQNLVKNYSSYRKFGGMGLLLMGKNFYALDDAFQATYVLENVTKSFTAFPEIVAEAQAELTKIKTAEAKRNSSVTPNRN